jgi:hypothetical protein
MADEYGAIPDPRPTVESLHEAVTAMKQMLEVMIGQRGTGNSKAVKQSDLDTLHPPVSITMPPFTPIVGGTPGRLLFNSAGAIRELVPVTFANLPSTPGAGMVANISDSNTTTWGASISGGGVNSVLAWYNGGAWKVIGI